MTKIEDFKNNLDIIPFAMARNSIQEWYKQVLENTQENPFPEYLLPKDPPPTCGLISDYEIYLLWDTLGIYWANVYHDSVSVDDFMGEDGVIYLKDTSKPAIKHLIENLQEILFALKEYCIEGDDEFCIEYNNGLSINVSMSFKIWLTRMEILKKDNHIKEFHRLILESSCFDPKLLPDKNTFLDRSDD